MYGLRMFVVSVLSLVVICVALSSDASAQRFDKRTTITINKPFEVPGRTLPAGEYVIRLMDIAGNRNVVQILSSDEQKSFAILLAISDYRLKAPQKTEISFYEAKAGTPAPLHAWFYPASNFGVEFVYPKSKAVEIAKDSGEYVIATTAVEPINEPTPSELKSEPLVVIEPGGTEASELSTEAESLRRIRAILENDDPINFAYSPPATEPVLTAEALPRTATPFPLVALIGLLAAGVGGTLTFMRRRMS